ncbi:cytochrome C [Bacteroidota bacterium]
MKLKFIKFSFVLILHLFLIGTAFTVNMNPETEIDNKKVIIFSHQFHYELEVECEDCHPNALESSSLEDRLLPKKDDCASCHDVNDEEECKSCHYENVYESLKEKIQDLHFNHKFHLTNQNMECTKCHKDFDEIDYSNDISTNKPLMQDCYSCHNNQSIATMYCESCHISTANLIPNDHKISSFSKNHKYTTLNDNENCIMCHDNSFCETCHISTVAINEKNIPTDFYTPYSPHKFKDDIKQQQLTRIHEINYRFTHGIDATGKTSECRTCHEVESFCVECHNSSESDFALSGLAPSSHSLPNFTTIGFGSGGGEHAVLAKRDIESCTACHNTYGADPNCILCHVDNDGNKNTNPKTHELNFRGDEHGDWHSDDGSICYNCHIDPNAHPNGIAGIGFCSYCHGAN